MSASTGQRYPYAGYYSGIHSRRRAHTSLLIGYSAAAATLLTAILLAASLQDDSMALIIPVVLFGACAVALAIWLVRPGNFFVKQKRSSEMRKSLLAQLTPVLCLSAAFPLAGRMLSSTHVGSISAAALILAGSLATPWLSQVVCTPLFTALSAEPQDGRAVSLGSRWLSQWPFVAISSMPVAAAFGAGIGLVLRWDSTATDALMVLCALNALFSQSMVVGIIQRNYLPWASAWFAYATALATIPEWWFLPPIAGLLTQLWYLGIEKPSLMPLIPPVGILKQFGKGILTGGIMWSDKLFFFLRAERHFEAQFVFLAVLPAIITYGYYFVRLAPALDQIVTDMRTTMEHDALAHSEPRLRELTEKVEESIVKVACMGAILCLLGVIGVILIAPSVSLLYAGMAVASTSFLVVTVLLYKLDYVGRGDLVYRFSGIHLALVAGALLIGAPGPETYMTLAVLSAAVSVAAARSVLTAWRLPEYSLFWRHAVLW